MAGPNFVLDKGFQCSGAIRQFRAVEFTAQEIVGEANTAGEPTIGVCQEEISANDATLGRVANIRLFGISRMISGGTCTFGQRAEVDNQGRVVNAAATVGLRNTVGIFLQSSAAAGDHVDVMLTPGVTYNTAVS